MDKVTQELSCNIFGLRIYPTKNNSLMWLSIQYYCSLRSCNHQRNDSKVLFSFNNDRYRRMFNCMFECMDEIIGQCTRRIFHPDALTMDYLRPSARGAHGISINHRYCRSD